MTVLLSGMDTLVGEVANELRARQEPVIEVTDIERVPKVCAESGDVLDAYVQLPAKFTIEGRSAIERVHHFYADGVLARFGALAGALDRLGTGARLVFVLGRLPADVGTSHDLTARHELVTLLAQAARADAPGKNLVVRVLDSGATAPEIADATLPGARPAPGRDELSDAELRLEMFTRPWLET